MTSGKLSLVAVAMVFFASSASWAWSSSSTSITGIQVFEDGHVWATFGAWGTGNNACGSNGFSLGVASSAARNQFLALALTAYTQGKNVSVTTDAGQCDGGQERVQTLILNQ